MGRKSARRGGGSGKAHQAHHGSESVGGYGSSHHINNGNDGVKYCNKGGVTPQTAVGGTSTSRQGEGVRQAQDSCDSTGRVPNHHAFRPHTSTIVLPATRPGGCMQLMMHCVRRQEVRCDERRLSFIPEGNR